jgi:Dna[CI] antecedent DciA-like protein
LSGTHFFPRRRDEAVDGILRRALDLCGLSQRLDRHVPRKVWADAVGAELAARAQPTVLSGGTLHLLVQDHRWRDQIDAARALIIERVNLRLGRPLVRALQFGLAHDGALRPAARETHTAAPPPRGGWAAAESDAIPAEVRDAFLRAVAASLRNAPKD